MEKIVHAKLSMFLSCYLSDFQSGFKKHDDTTLQLTRIIQQWSEDVDQSRYVRTVLFDLRKAFDRVWHRGLWAEMEQAGVCGSALAGFWSYLLGRRQVVTVDGVLSDFEYLQAGVPQGAILSPLLFSLYMNDISASPESQINLFADDTSLYVVHK